MTAIRVSCRRRTEAGIKGDMVNINPSLTADSSDAEKFAAFAEGVIKGTVSTIKM